MATKEAKPLGSKSDAPRRTKCLTRKDTHARVAGRPSRAPVAGPPSSLPGRRGHEPPPRARPPSPSAKGTRAPSEGLKTRDVGRPPFSTTHTLAQHRPVDWTGARRRHRGEPRRGHHLHPHRGGAGRPGDGATRGPGHAVTGDTCNGAFPSTRAVARAASGTPFVADCARPGDTRVEGDDSGPPRWSTTPRRAAAPTPSWWRRRGGPGPLRPRGARHPPGARPGANGTARDYARGAALTRGSPRSGPRPTGRGALPRERSGSKQPRRASPRPAARGGAEPVENEM
jgi:hypothetical protein